MPYTMEDYRREKKKELLEELTLEERLAGVPLEEIVKRLSVEELLAKLPRQVIEEFLNREKNGASASESESGPRG